MRFLAWAHLHVRETPFFEFAWVHPGAIDIFPQLLRQIHHQGYSGSIGSIGRSRFHMDHRWSRCKHHDIQPYWNANGQTQHSTLQPGFLKFAYILTILLLVAKVAFKICRCLWESSFIDLEIMMTALARQWGLSTFASIWMEIYKTAPLLHFLPKGRCLRQGIVIVYTHDDIFINIISYSFLLSLLSWNFGMLAKAPSASLL